MLTVLFLIIMFCVFGNLLGLALRAAWGITKIFFTILFLPVILLLMFFMGAIYLAIPILLVIGIVSLIARVN